MKAQTFFFFYAHLLRLKIFHSVFILQKNPYLSTVSPVKRLLSSIILSTNYPLPGAGHLSSKALGVTWLEYLVSEESNFRFLHSKFQKRLIPLLSNWGFATNLSWTSLKQKNEGNCSALRWGYVQQKNLISTWCMFCAIGVVPGLSRYVGIRNFERERKIFFFLYEVQERLKMLTYRQDITFKEDMMLNLQNIRITMNM